MPEGMPPGDRGRPGSAGGWPRRQLSLLFLVVFLDLLGFSLILPLLPFYATAFGATAGQVGLLIAANAAASLVASPVLARLSDGLGRRPVLLLGILGTSASFVILGLATSLLVLFLSRVLDGLTGAVTPVAQAYVADITSERQRARGLGIIGAAFGLGFIAGPALGGLLSRYGFAFPAFVAAGVTASSWLLLYARLPESLTRERRAELARAPRTGLSLSFLKQAFRRRRVVGVLSTRFFYGLAAAAFQAVFALYALLRFGVTAQTVGLILTYVGALIVFVQAVAIGWLTARVPENRLILAALLLLALAFVAWALAPNVAALLLALAPLSLSLGVLNTVLNSVLSKSVPPEQVGGILGISTSTDNLTRVIGPTAGGFILQGLGTAAPGLVAAAVVAAVVPLTWRTLGGGSRPPAPG